MKSLGAYVVNIIPMIPVPGTKFADLQAPTAEQRKKLQDLCEPDIKQMRHCRFCRADAIGLLGEDRSARVRAFLVPGQGPAGQGADRGADGGRFGPQGGGGHAGRRERGPAFRPGQEVPGLPGGRRHDQRDGPDHVGQAPNVALSGDAHKGKLEMLAEVLRGCDLVVAMSFGTPAKEYLREEGIMSYTAKGAVRIAVKESVDALFQDRANTFE